MQEKGKAPNPDKLRELINKADNIDICKACKGTGGKPSNPCKACNGTGKVQIKPL
jgi:DnaJ-class molecular chaperone